MQRIIKIVSILIILFIITNSADTDCTSARSPLTGCLACTTPATFFLTVNRDTGNYTCSNVKNCQKVLSNGTCVECQGNFVLSNQTFQCYPIVQNCLVYNPQPVGTALQCTQCLLNFMTAANKCLVDAAICQTFNYTSLICTQCPAGLVSHSSRQYCISIIPNCLNVQYDGCQQCQQQYTIASDKKSCILTQGIEYQLSLTSGICLQQNFYFDASVATAITCTQLNPIPTLAQSYCLSIDAITKNCTACLTGYYLNSAKSCKQCRRQIQNCLACLPCTNLTLCSLTCQACAPQHFLYSDSISNQCRSCSVYNCKTCVSVNQTVTCLSCQKDQTLFNGTCYTCPPTQQLDLVTLQCQNCAIANCKFCSNNRCLECITGYAIDALVDNNKCLAVATYLTSATLTPQTLNELLLKSLPSHQYAIYNNQIQLISTCLESGFRYSCLCKNATNLVSSLCYRLSGIGAYNFALAFPVGVTNQVFLQYSQTLRIMAQLPAFDQLAINIDPLTLILPQSKIASLMEIYVQVLRRAKAKVAVASQSQQYQLNQDQSIPNQQRNRLLITSDQAISQLFSLITNSFSKTFSLTETTVIYGNGYYMKFYPNGFSSTQASTQFVTLSKTGPLTEWKCVFIWFQNSQSSKSLTGSVYIITPSASHQQIVTIQRIQYPQSSFTLKFTKSSTQILDVTQITSSSNSLTFPLLTSTTTAPLSYNVEYETIQAASIDQLYSSERIEFIFYQPAFIYILIFLIAYLFLIPCCSLVDFMAPKQAHNRKRVRSMDLSQEAKHQQHSQQQSSQSVVIAVNYKDFFPLYNICNTPRPRRILKLCLFLLNMQHGITFLTLIYYNLDPNHPVVAVVLGVPAYFCTVIMGYICGGLTLCIPGWFKYSINIIVLGYWILWISLMPRFLSQEYQPYVFIFAIVFFVIDLIVDMLEMFMVYFTIKQADRAISMFKCLATWLSKRGYYEYDKLANQLNDA